MLIKARDREQLTAHFARALVGPVRLVMFTQGQSEGAEPVSLTCQRCQETEQMVRELAELSDKITAEIYDFVADGDKAREYGVDKIPAIAVVGEQDYGVRFFGIPAGYEFSSLIRDITAVSQGDTELAEGTKNALKNLDADVHIQVLVTLTCPYCPRAVHLAHQMAIESDRVRADMVETQEFPHLVQRYKVYGVPRVVLNEDVSFEGALPEQQFLLYVLQAAGQLSGE
jgi:glutaredoxin-like protein